MSITTAKRAALTFVLVLVGIVVAVGYRARFVNPYRLKVERITIPLPTGAEALAGLRIGFIADLHAGPFITEDDVRRATELVAAAAPDLVLFGGDYVSESPRYIRGTLNLLESLAQKAPQGAFAVLGNHDISTSITKIDAAFAATSIRLLRNEARPIVVNDTRFWIVGIDETLIGTPDPVQAFALVPDGEPAIVLWHEAEFAEEAANRGAIVQLSGHSHGGQVRLPVLGAMWLPEHGRRFVAGLNSVSGMPVYTSRGTGVYRPPMRLLCPPEVTIITLAATNES